LPETSRGLRRSLHIPAFPVAVSEEESSVLFFCGVSLGFPSVFSFLRPLLFFLALVPPPLSKTSSLRGHSAFSLNGFPSVPSTQASSFLHQLFGPPPVRAKFQRLLLLCPSWRARQLEGVAFSLEPRPLLSWDLIMWGTRPFSLGSMQSPSFFLFVSSLLLGRGRFFHMFCSPFLSPTARRRHACFPPAIFLRLP